MNLENAMKLTLYIYNVDTNEVVETFEGSTNAECEKLAEEANWCIEQYGWSYINPNAVPTERPNRGELFGLVLSWSIADAVAVALKNS